MSINFGNSDQSSTSGSSNTKPNSMALYGGIAAVVIGGLGYYLIGGNSQTEARNISFSQGQEVIIENPNGGLSHITAGPGMMSASVSEEDREQSICTAQPGTHGKIEEVQVIDLLSYVKVTMTDGDCEGKSGWTTKTNIKIAG